MACSTRTWTGFDLLFLERDREVVGLSEAAGDAIGPSERLGVGARLVSAAAEDQGHARLVNQDAVHLVHYGVVVASLGVAHAVGEFALLDVPSAQDVAEFARDGALSDLVAEEVEAELLVRAVGDVAGVGGAALLLAHSGLDAAHREAQPFVNRPHPFAVALGEVVVDRDDVDALPGDGVQGGGHGGGEGLALTGLHLGRAAAVEDVGAEDLDVEVAHRDEAGGALADGREDLGEQGFEGAPLAVEFAPAAGHRAELLVGEFAHVGLEGVDPGDQAAVAQGHASELCGAFFLVHLGSHGRSASLAGVIFAAQGPGIKR